MALKLVFFCIRRWNRIQEIQNTSVVYNIRDSNYEYILLKDNIWRDICLKPGIFSCLYYWIFIRLVDCKTYWFSNKDNKKSNCWQFKWKNSRNLMSSFFICLVVSILSNPSLFRCSNISFNGFLNFWQWSSTNNLVFSSYKGVAEFNYYSKYNDS